MPNARIKILYLHMFEDAKSFKIRRAIENIYGRENVVYPTIQYRKLSLTLMITLCLIYFSSIFLAFTYLSKLKDFVYILIPIWVAVTLFVLLPGFILIYEVVHKKCVNEARELFRTFNPDVIVAYHLGWTVADRMNEMKVPMLLICPVQENIVSSYFRKAIIIEDYPYMLFIHTSNDKKYYLNKTLKMVEGADKKKFRVEIVDGGYNLELLNISDYKNWIEEIYAQNATYLAKRKEEKQSTGSETERETDTEDPKENPKEPLLKETV